VSITPLFTHQLQEGRVNVTIYHNPRCSKSRQTLEILQARRLQPVIIEYLKTPPSHDELDKLLRLLNFEPRDLMRTKEKEYKQQHLDDPDLSRAQLIDSMIASPILIERPIVLANGKAAVGRPPEQVLNIL
jgi:arsenate reductase